MGEVLRHLFGVCGEHHPNILWALPFIGSALLIIKNKINAIRIIRR